MQVGRKVAIAAAAALALNSAGCAEFLTQLQQQGQQDPNAGAKRRAGLAQAAAAAEQDDALTLAMTGDSFRDGMSADYTSAHFAYRRALELEPRNTYVLVAQATAYLRQGSEALYSNPDGSATTDPTKRREAEKFFKRAENLAKKALEVNKDYGTAHFVVAEMYALMGSYDKAAATLDSIEKSNIIPEGHKSTFFAWKGYVYKVSGQEDKAKEAFQSAIDLAEPVDMSEYAERILNPPAGQAGAFAKPAIVKAQ
jgi:tetratricopeptide (TPR) repeat protein